MKLKIPYEYKALLTAFLLSLIIYFSINFFLKKSIEKEKVVVVKVIDGDTFYDNKGRRIRMIGINTPEVGEKCYYEAKSFLESLINGKEVIIERENRDKDIYGRLLRNVYLDGKYLNLLMIERGYAKYYETNSKYSKVLKEAEIKARENGIGCLWSR